MTKFFFTSPGRLRHILFVLVNNGYAFEFGTAQPDRNDNALEPRTQIIICYRDK